MNAMEPAVRNDRLARLAWLPVPLLLFATIILWIADSPAVYEPPRLVAILNLFFMLPAALLIAYQTGRGFLLRGNPRLLWFGCGMLFWGSAGPVGGALLSHGPNVVVTVHNTLIWLSAACHLAGLVLAPWQRAVRWPEPWLAGAYAGAATLGVAVVLETLVGEMPTFFIQGEGGTLLRQIVLGSAIAMFVLAAILLKGNRSNPSSAFRNWYALALSLIAAGLFGVMVQSSVGSPVGWAGRIAQYLGGAYLLVAAVISMRETRDLGYSLEIALGEVRQRFEELFNLAADGIVMHELMSKTTHGNFLQANPAICALLGYTPQEMSELTPLDITLLEDREQTSRDVQAMERKGLLRHEKILIAKDGRRIPVEISTRQYQQRNRKMVISLIRDITERKRVEESLRAERDRFAKIVVTVPGVICSFRLRPDGSACFPYASPASEYMNMTDEKLAPKAMNELNMRVADSLEREMVIIRNPEDDEVAGKYLEMARNHYKPSFWGFIKNRKKRFLAEKRAANDLNDLSVNHPDTFYSFSEKVDDYFQKLKMLGISDKQFAIPFFEKVLYLLFAVVFAIPGLVGIALNFLPITLAESITRKKVKNLEFFDSVNFGIGMVLGVIYFWLLVLILMPIFGWYGFLIALGIRVLGFLYYYWSEAATNTLHWFKLMFTSKGRNLNKALKSQREFILHYFG